MEKSKFLILFLAHLHFLVFSQNSDKGISKSRKPNVTLLDINGWSSASNGKISNDGRYGSYLITNLPAGKSTLVIQGLEDSWKKEIVNGKGGDFSLNGDFFIYKIGRDTLVIIRLSDRTEELISGAMEFKLPASSQGNWMAYEVKGAENKVVLRNLKVETEVEFSNVHSYKLVSDDGLLVETMNDGKTEATLRWVNLSVPGNATMIWKGENSQVTGYALDHSNEQLAFIVESKCNNATENQIWYYKRGLEKAVNYLSSTTKGVKDGFELSSETPYFSGNGQNIIIGLIPKVKVEQKAKANVEIWSYLDPLLKLIQKEELTRNENKVFHYAYHAAKNEAIQIESINENLEGIKGNYALVKYEFGRRGLFEASWNPLGQFAYYLVNLSNGERKLIRGGIVNPSENVSFSKNGKWLIYFNLERRSYFTYEVETGKTKDVTSGVTTNWLNELNDTPDKSLPGSIYWTDGDSAVLIKDSYDVWEVDAFGKFKPKNITKGFGRKYKIQFEVVSDGSDSPLPIKGQPGVILLRAFDLGSKKSGFYKASLDRHLNLELCSMGPYVYNGWNSYGNYTYPIQKAKYGERYLVTRMSAAEAPNYLVTEDFKKFSNLSNVQYQKNFNWYVTELHEWTAPDGTKLQGILYKPENFDPHKKYPVVFNYYEKRSNELNVFIYPGVSDGSINIPLFVANGYLVFVPDIKYKLGEPGASAYNSVVSAAKYLMRYSWVDPEALGIQGHSFGGYETLFIITNTNLFKAACSAAGASDLISKYGSGLRGGYPMYHSERSQGRIGATLWERPDLYIKNSPIFGANKVTTPLLMMHNMRDGSVPFTQGVEFFSALRRLGKRVWMLQYSEGDHGVSGRDAEDFHIRMLQFFDHYLKHARAPKWMTRGVPGISNDGDGGMDLDSLISTPGKGFSLK